jgi:hypothetical protein
MAYNGLKTLTPDDRNQDPFNEPMRGEYGPYASTGGGVEVAMVAFYKGSLNNFSFILTSLLAVASVVKVYGCNQLDLHATDPLANNRLHLLKTINLGVSETVGDYVEGGWRYLVFTEDDAGAGTPALYQLDIAANSRR